MLLVLTSVCRYFLCGILVVEKAR